MIRKTLMGALTLVLLGVFIYLTVQSRRSQKEAAKPAVEVVKSATPTAIRVVAPDDLSITGEELKIAGSTAHHRMVIQNHGKSAYSTIELSITYLGSSGKALARRTYLIDKTILPGQSLSFDSIVVENIAKGAKTCTVRILYADLNS